MQLIFYTGLYFWTILLDILFGLKFHDGIKIIILG